MWNIAVWIVALWLIGAGARVGAEAVCEPGVVPPDSVRFASFNVHLYRQAPGQLLADLQSGDDQLEVGASDRQIRAVAEIIQRVRPDVLLLNEFDYDEAGDALRRFQTHFLAVSQNGEAPIHYEYNFNRPSNTGVATGLDLDGGGPGGPADAMGYGLFPGQYGMALLSKYPVAAAEARTFQKFLWRDMPNARLPRDFYDARVQAILRLSSKSHWDVPVVIDGTAVHVLAAHPTPPVFDGPEDRNGRRNFDEIRLWADYIGDAADYLVDDQGLKGGLGVAPFVIMGDYNADPHDGDSVPGAMAQLLRHPVVAGEFAPASAGAAEDALREGGANRGHRGDPRHDTGDFSAAGAGNLRIDYVLPSKLGLQVVCGGVFWPAAADEAYYLVGDGSAVVSSDHRLVWLDLRLE